MNEQNENKIWNAPVQIAGNKSVGSTYFQISRSEVEPPRFRAIAEAPGGARVSVEYNDEYNLVLSNPNLFAALDGVHRGVAMTTAMAGKTAIDAGYAVGKGQGKTQDNVAAKVSAALAQLPIEMPDAGPSFAEKYAAKADFSPSR